jgi:hypothetical protein
MTIERYPPLLFKFKGRITTSFESFEVMGYRIQFALRDEKGTYFGLVDVGISFSEN